MKASVALLLVTLVLAALSGAEANDVFGNCRITCTGDMLSPGSLCNGAVQNYRTQYCINLGAQFTQVSNYQLTCGADGLDCSKQTYIDQCNYAPNLLMGACGPCTSSLTDCTDKKCFPANSTVTLQDGSLKRMDQIAVGDKVLTKSNMFSDVYMFSHKLSAVHSEFVRITTEGGRSITLTGNHYLYANDRMAVASVVKVGDSLITSTGAPDKVAEVSRIWADGLYNPHTMQGDIVVDGILTSTYTSDIHPTLAHAALWPVRMLHSMGKDIVGDSFAEGSDLLASIMPDGKKQY